MQRGEPKKLSFWRNTFHTVIETGASLLGGVLLIVCCYWFFHYETWHERFIAIGLTILVVHVIVKLLPERTES
ncbi:hypothetical protein SY86_16565 [Erwinia tracheiphila]|uniref:Uncharacterized protein n=1 Tax=Erwinia tracheiphila TaxID=65700 RepID=A0A0M2KBF0_9GAMM|nr:hypothetical protein SY86_16565 [Erwinia tracheiphila]